MIINPVLCGKTQTDEAAEQMANNWRNLMLSQESSIAQTKSFYQLAKGSSLPSGATGLVANSSFWWVSASETATTAAQVLATVKPLTSLALTKGQLAACQPMVLTFTLQGPGRVNQLRMTGSCSDNDGCKGIFQMRLTNTTTGEVEIDTEVSTSSDMSIFGSSASGTWFIKCDLPLRGASDYQMELTPKEENWTANFSYDNLNVKALASSAETGTLTRSVAGASTSGGTAFVHYTKQGAGGTVSLTWAGKSLAPAVVRSISGTGAAAIYEAEFRTDGTIPAGSSVTLTLTATPTGGLSLLGWGAALL